MDRTLYTNDATQLWCMMSALPRCMRVLLPTNLSLATHTLVLSDRSGSDLLSIDNAVYFYLNGTCYQPVKTSANSLAEHLHNCAMCAFIAAINAREDLSCNVRS